ALLPGQALFLPENHSFLLLNLSYSPPHRNLQARRLPCVRGMSRSFLSRPLTSPCAAAAPPPDRLVLQQPQRFVLALLQSRQRIVLPAFLLPRQPVAEDVVAAARARAQH